MSQKLQLKRNYNIYNTKNDALEYIKQNYNIFDDGEIVLFRYKDDNNSLKTIVSVIGVDNTNNNKSYTIFESIHEVKFETTSGVKISNKEGEKNFLVIDSENNGLKVIGMDADKVSTQEITIVGTPLADLILSKRPEMDKISGNVQEILELLLSEELWPENIGIIEPKINGSVSVPSPSSQLSPVA